MANPYTSPAISGYNSSPPADDGSQDATNEIAWSKHKTKLSDPVKTLAESDVTNTSAAFAKIAGNAFSAITTNTTLDATHQGKFLKVTNATTITLLAAATAGSGFFLAIRNAGIALVTLDGNASETINGATTIVLRPNEWAIITCDGSNWEGEIFQSQPPVAQTGAFTIALADHDRVIECTGTFSASIGAVSGFNAGFFTTVKNTGTGVITIDPDASEDIDGYTTLTLYEDESVTIMVDNAGTAWQALGRTQGQSNFLLQSGTAGQVLTSTGAGSNPTYQTVDDSVAETDIAWASFLGVSQLSIFSSNDAGPLTESSATLTTQTIPPVYIPVNSTVMEYSISLKTYNAGQAASARLIHSAHDGSTVTRAATTYGNLTGTLDVAGESGWVDISIQLSNPSAGAGDTSVRHVVIFFR